jgi:RNA polymerase primary sigma factor
MANLPARAASLAIASFALFHRVDAMVATKTVSRANARPLTLTGQSFPTAPQHLDLDERQIRRWKDAVFDDDFEDYDGDDDDDDMEVEVDGFQQLQRSTGSEILNEELQRQIDEASATPNKFLDSLVHDASYMEKIAMSSIPAQLPRGAVSALNKKIQTDGLTFSKTRVTPEEEVELGSIIQKGVKLHKIRSDFEAKAGRQISRQEWTELTGLASAKHLRHQVSEYRRAKQLLVAANVGLVHAVVKKQYSEFRARGLSFDELVQEGSLGLLRAAELFDASKGLRFSTYATIWIKGTLSNSHVKETIKLPLREKTKWNKIVKAQTELTRANGGEAEPTIEELASYVGMTVAEVLDTKRKMSHAQQILSLDYEYQTQTRSGGESGSLNSLENDKNFRADADLAERAQMHADLVAAMARNLDGREARLMRLRYGLSDGHTRSLSECADAMGLSQTRVQQLAKSSLKKMREAAEAGSLEEYLLTIA